jgi:hypothetical protein
MPFNVFTAENTEGRTDVARALESAETAMYIYDLSPGQTQCPHHYEYNEEWLLVSRAASSSATPTASTP